MNSDTVEVHRPATGEKIASLRVASAADVARAVAKARTAQALWEKKHFSERAEVLFRYRDLLIDHQEKMADVVTAEIGKPRAEVYGNELFYLYDTIGFWAGNAAKYLAPEKIRPHLLKS
ncbi:MAG: aldehyde dehydrogenase family protein, partial [Candidatus Binatia bacterium]